MKQGKILNASFAASALALAGCMVGPDYVEPSFKIAEEELMKEHFSRDESLWKSALPADSLPKGDWWKVFDDPQLDALLKCAVKTARASRPRSGASNRRARPPLWTRATCIRS